MVTVAKTKTRFLFPKPHSEARVFPKAELTGNTDKLKVGGRTSLQEA